MNGKTIIALTFITLVVLVATGLYIEAVAAQELQSGIRLFIKVLAWSLSLLVGLLALVTLLAFTWIAGEKANQATESRQMMAAQREKAQAEALLAKRDAEVLVIKARSDEQVHIRDANRTAIWRPAHLDPRFHVNGLPSLPSPFEMAAWGHWNLPAGPATSSSTPA